MSGFPYYMVLKSSRPLPEQAFVAIGIAVAMLAERTEEDSVTDRRDGYEVHLERTGKYGIIGSFGGEELRAIYADERGIEVRVSFLANMQHMRASSAYLN